MTQEHFKAQIERLASVWERAYPQERVRLIFNAVKHMPDFWMESSVNDFIANHRQPPLLKEFLEKITEYQEKQKVSYEPQGMGGASFPEVLAIAANKSPNKSFANECSRIVRDFYSEKLTREQFGQACNLLDQVAGTCLPGVCTLCGNNGYVVEESHGTRFLYRCPCQAGSARPATAPGPVDRNGNREEVAIPRKERR